MKNWCLNGKRISIQKYKRETKKAGATIYFTDESGIGSDYHTGQT
jgi:hypothetical protein